MWKSHLTLPVFSDDCGDTYRDVLEALPKRNFFQRIWDLIDKFFVFIGLS
jgi:hypothetical protein